MAGLAERRGHEGDSFWTWREAMYRFVDQVQPEEMEAIAALAYAEMLESGFTRVGEFHYLHHDLRGHEYENSALMAQHLALAASNTGIGMTLLPVFYAQGGFGGVPPTQAQRRFLCNLKQFAELFRKCREMLRETLPDAVLGVAPHSLRAVMPEQLEDLCAMVGRGPIHIHVAEQRREVEDCIEWSGTRPVQWLLDNAEVDERWCLVHATHVDDEELAAMVARRAVVGLCPVTEANLGDGLFPAARFMALGGRFGVGSDSNVHIDAMEELRILEYGQRLTHQARNVLALNAGDSTGAALFHAARTGGAQALGVADRGLAVGAVADIVGFDDLDVAFAGRYPEAYLDAVVFAAQKPVREVWRRGELVVVAGRHVRREAIESGYRRAVSRVLGGGAG